MFRNKESAILDNMMKRIKPKEEVARIKKAILLSKMKKQAGKLLPVSFQFFRSEYYINCTTIYRNYRRIVNQRNTRGI